MNSLTQLVRNFSSAASSRVDLKELHLSIRFEDVIVGLDACVSTVSFALFLVELGNKSHRFLLFGRDYNVPRYKLIVEYDGAPFAGWQIQADAPTVQGVLTAAIEALSGEKTLVQGAGRTDAGVHARGQVAHVDLARDWDTDTVRDALNAHLRPHPVAILSAERVAGALRIEEVTRDLRCGNVDIDHEHAVVVLCHLFGSFPSPSSHVR